MFKLYLFTVGILSGIGISPHVPLATASLLVLLLPISIFTLFLCYRLISIQQYIATFVLAVTLGLSWAHIHTHSVLAWVLPEQYVGKLTIVSGTVNSLPKRFNQSTQFDLHVQSICDSDGACSNPNADIRLNWYRPKKILHAGDRVTAQVKLKPLPILSNPGGRNMSKSFFLAKIRAVGTVHRLIEITPSASFASLPERLRQLCLMEMKPNLNKLEYGKILEALTLGISQGFTSHDWEVFQKTGTGHLMSISGLHIGLIAGLFLWVGQRLWRQNVRLTSKVPAHLAGGVVALLSALIYSLLAGFSVPTQRSLIMIAFVVLAKSLKRRLSFGQILCLAILAIVLMDVLAVYSEGFWLSIVGVFFLLALSQNPGRFMSVKLQGYLLIGMFPFTLWFFSQFTLSAPIANFFAIPIVGLGVVPLALLGVGLSFINASLSQLCFYVADRIFAVVWFLLEKIAQWPLYFEYSITPLQFVLVAIGCCVLLLPKGMPLRFVGLLGFIPIFFNQSPKPGFGEAWLYVLDVGQGLTNVVETRNHILVFDTGPRYGGHSDAGERIIWPFLRTKRMTELDTVILSHNDSDHIGGFQSLAKHTHVQTVLGSDPSPFEGEWQRQTCERGQTWHWDGVDFEILHPSKTYFGKKNDRSCVLQVTVGSHKVLLPGDIEKKAEAQLLKYDKTKLQSNIVVVPHHGSLTSSTEAFVRATAPDYALFAVGIANQYGHPKLKVVERYEAIGSAILLTRETGAIWFKLIPDKPIAPPVLWREKERLVWDK